MRWTLGAFQSPGFSTNRNAGTALPGSSAGQFSLIGPNASAGLDAFVMRAADRQYDHSFPPVKGRKKMNSSLLNSKSAYCYYKSAKTSARPLGRCVIKIVPLLPVTMSSSWSDSVLAPFLPSTRLSTSFFVSLILSRQARLKRVAGPLLQKKGPSAHRSRRALSLSLPC